MASIKISELRPAGSEFFQDSESFLSELSDNREIDQVLGGKKGNNYQTSIIIVASIFANTKNNNGSIVINNG